MMAGQAFYRYLPNVERYYAPDRFHFTYPLFEWVAPLPNPGGLVEIVVMGCAAAGLMAGAYYRVSALVFVAIYTHLFLIDKALYNNHYYLIILLGAFFAVSNGHAAWSLDRRRVRHRPCGWIPFWQVGLFRAQFVVVYFFAGIAKLNGDWLRGEPMRHWLANRADYPVVGPWFEHAWAAYFLSYGGLAFDLAIGFLLLWRPTRLIAVVPFLLFHVTNHWLFTIGIFPWLAMAGLVVFFEPDAPRRWLRWMGFELGRADLPEGRATLRGPQHLVAVLLTLYLFVQIGLPLRHFAYGGNVNWNEAGHDFAWQMKVREKDSVGRFEVVDGETGERWTFDTAAQRRTLSGLQQERMLKRPQMILEYAHFLRDAHEALGVKAPRVYAKVLVSLDGRPYEPLIDSDVNLASVEYPLFRVPEWVAPLEPGLPIGEYPPKPDGP